MKTIKRLLSLALCLALMVAVAPQAMADPALRAYCYNFQVNDDGINLTGISFSMGAQYGTEPYTLSYEVGGLSGTASAGKVTLPMTLAAGSHSFTVTVTAKDNAGASSTATLTATVTVNEDGSYEKKVTSSVAPETVKVTKITLNQSAVILHVGNTAQLTATAEPTSAANRAVTFSSSDTAVATVSDGGLVTGAKAGTCTVTATAADGSGVTASCVITVLQPVTGLTLSPASGAIAVGGKLTLTANVSPADASNKNVTYATSNSTVAAVANDGTVIGLAEGVAVITAISVDDPTKTASSSITVGLPVTAITLSQNSAGLDTGKTLALSAAVTPENATNKNVVWTTSDSSIATVSSSGVVSTWKAGTATITATAADGSGKSASCTVTVTGAEVTQPATSTPTPTPTPTPGGTGTPVTSAPTLTPPDGQTAYVNTPKGSLNLRKNPSQSATRLTAIPENGSMTVLTYGKTWCYVWYNGYYGYVMTKFIRLGGPAPTDTTPAGPTPSPAPEAPTGTTAFVYTEKGSLNLRKSASQSAEILARIPENGSFTVVTYGTNWCYAWYNGRYGYVMSKFVRLAGETAMPSETDTPKVTNTPAPVTPTPTPVAPLSGNQARVTTPSGKLNLRKTPNQASARVALMAPGTIVEVLTYGPTWCYVRYNGLTGYAMTKFLTLSSAIATATPAPTVPASTGTEKYAQVSTPQGGLNLRKGAGLGYARVLVIPENAYVQVITTGKDWCYVKYNNYVGYVMTKFLKMM